MGDEINQFTGGKEDEFIKHRRETREEIAKAYEIKPHLVGKQVSSFENRATVLNTFRTKLILMIADEIDKIIMKDSKEEDK